MKTSRNPRASERGAPPRQRGQGRSRAKLVPLSPSIFDKKNWRVQYHDERGKTGRPIMWNARLGIYPQRPLWSWEEREQEGYVHLNEPLYWASPIRMRAGTWGSAVLRYVAYTYTPKSNLLEARYHLYMGEAFDPVAGQAFENALTYVVYYGNPVHKLRDEEFLLEEHEKGPRGLEEAVKMARADFEKRMLKGDIQPGHTNPDLVSYNEIVTLTPEEVADVRSAIEEAIRPSDEGDRHRHTLPLNVRRSVQRLFPVRRGETNRVYRREVDVLLEWYHGLPRQNPRARLVRRTPKRKVSR